MVLRCFEKGKLLAATMAYQTWVYRTASQTGDAEGVEVEQNSLLLYFFLAPRKWHVGCCFAGVFGAKIIAHTDIIDAPEAKTTCRKNTVFTVFFCKPLAINTYCHTAKFDVLAPQPHHKTSITEQTPLRIDTSSEHLRSFIFAVGIVTG